ncbi:MAG: glycosyltransferase family 4 protein [Pseudomonadota bacterium]|nr:glycosyltransferase family 4 protein [Pseudomonadota bacterium]
MKLRLRPFLELKRMDGEPPAADPVDRVRHSPLFDPDFYAAALAARGQALDGLDPAAHYFERGDAARAPPHPLFDPSFYAERNPDVVAAGVNLLQHYLDNGHREGRDPHPLVDLALLKSQLAPDFSGDPLIAYALSRGPLLQPHKYVDPAYLAAQQRRLDPRDDRPALLFYLTSDADVINPSAEFDGAGYRLLYPDSRGVNPLVHFVRYGEAMGRAAPKERGPIGRAAALIEKAAALDPDIVKPFADLAATPLLNGYDMARREFRLYRLLAKATGRQPHAHVILTPWLKRGGADRAVLHVARGLLESDPAARVLIVCTQDNDAQALDWAPVSQRLRIAKIAHEVDDVGDTYVAFCNFLRFAGCRHLYVVNSRFGWDVVEKYGHALKSQMRLYGFAFCQDYDDAGRRAGYAWTRLGRAIDHLAAVVSDNGRVRDEFAADHGFDGDDLAKFFTLPLPVDARLDGVALESVADNLRGERRRRQVIWAGRFTAQKALDVAAEAARLAPEIDFCAYGGAAAETSAVATGNFRIGGAFDDFADLPLHEASLFLHTARWEGLPNVLLEAGAAGLPIVARDVGGVADLVDATTGWLVPRAAGAEAFVAAIRDALARPDEALARAQAMRERLLTRHSDAAFADGLRKLTQGGGA